MRAGQAAVRLAAGVAEDVERVFDDVVPGRSDDVQEKLAGEFAGRETRARTSRLSIVIAAPASPQSSHHSAMNFAGIIEQCQPATHLARRRSRTSNSQ